MENKHFDIPLKVLWIFNCNEAEIAVDFQLKPDGKTYQVKGSGIDAFNDEGDLKICLTDRLEGVYYRKPTIKVIIPEGVSLNKIWSYWKNGGGKNRYYELKNQHSRYKDLVKDQASLSSPLSEGRNINTELHTLKSKQIFNLVFEMEALYELKKAFKGDITDSEIDALIKASTEGFDESTTIKIKEEFLKKIKKAQPSN